MFATCVKKGGAAGIVNVWHCQSALTSTINLQLLAGHSTANDQAVIVM